MGVDRTRGLPHTKRLLNQLSFEGGNENLEPTPRNRTWDLLLTRQALSPSELCGRGMREAEYAEPGWLARVTMLSRCDRDSIKYQCDDLSDVTRSVTPLMANNSCGCSERSHYSLRLVIRLNIFDCYGRGDFGTDFLVATACRFRPVR
jgi:hypothetical protein